MGDLDLMQIRADTNFTYDGPGRMLRTRASREDQRGPAPRLFLGRTKDGYVVRFGATMPDALAERLEVIIDRQPPVEDLYALPPVLAEARKVLAQHVAITKEEAGPAYRFPEVIKRSEQVVQVTEENRELARGTYPWLYEELADWGPCFAVVQKGRVVSVCFSSRISADAAEAGVDTLPEFQKRGYASAATAAWGAAIRESGRIPLYSTSWENVASQGIARRVGLIMFGADTTWW